MPSNPRKIYWDSCAIIDFLQHTPGRYEDLKHFVEAAVKKECIIVTSTIAIAETQKCDKDGSPLRGKSQAEVNAAITEFFSYPFLSVRQVDRETAALARDFSIAHNVPFPDSVHAATAVRTICDELHTFDGENPGKRRKLLRYDGKLGTPPLKIVIPKKPVPPPEPEVPKPAGLFDQVVDPSIDTHRTEEGDPAVLPLKPFEKKEVAAAALQTESGPSHAATAPSPSA